MTAFLSSLHKTPHRADIHPVAPEVLVLHLQEIVLDIEPQEYLCRAVVTIIPVSQLSQSRPVKPAEQQQTAQQVSAFSAPFAQHPYSSTNASQCPSQDQSQSPYQLDQYLSQPPEQGSSPGLTQDPPQRSDQHSPAQSGQDAPQALNQDPAEWPDHELLQPLLRSPSQLPSAAPSTSDVRLNVIPENAQTHDDADTGPSGSQQTDHQVCGLLHTSTSLVWMFTNTTDQERKGYAGGRS